MCKDTQGGPLIASLIISHASSKRSLLSNFGLCTLGLHTICIFFLMNSNYLSELGRKWWATTHSCLKRSFSGNIYTESWHPHLSPHKLGIVESSRKVFYTIYAHLSVFASHLAFLIVCWHQALDLFGVGKYSEVCQCQRWTSMPMYLWLLNK